MKRFLILFSIGIITLCGFSVSSAEINGMSAQAYILYCVNNREIILSKDENRILPMASTTKIMTSLIAFDEAEKEDRVVEFTEEMSAEGSSMYLKVGDKLRLSDLASGMMAASGNDGANAIAYTLGGSEQGFAEIMNSYAEKIGMENTHFTNPSGLPDDNHYSTAYDMALLMSYAMENESFSSMTSKKSVTVDFISPVGHSATFQNHNRLLSLYDYTIGGKTGYTLEAGRCLVTCAEHDGLRFVAVTLDDGNDWEDHISLYEYGFENYSLLSVADKFYEISFLGFESEKIRLLPDKSISRVVEKPKAYEITSEAFIPSAAFPSAKGGDTLGKLVYYSQWEIIMETPLLAEKAPKTENTNSILRFFRNLFYRIF